ncbi:dicarboxylate/amino acid:cation symporter [Turicibacter sanguinis]|uniref:dicarboxylate/amino acid:cation symporter n=1 Tax=Turicibacter sanguinis TaxID=154288 RepID=UPI0012BC0F6D|nr:dicarboxylate/amino acid:cation symporter [Turicibacter sanguinis]MDB8436698.1 dicarboxylate/amino acid:cation symporter [Turicibacter sanguinis]MTO22489.1 cation:dicarboxylase symporter family transporter [Turicibacter sanguinis]MTO25499.1 cation:dicarboxylase symporter family transporter [Turicibacter sanguinis]MTO88311.1 cation:dicarboxylase symporter family transporter [Turicibacter sanguinis]MTP68893.1 cation:dicarboxylase symporter family transporter [Turicibacter sanguinis]
MKKMPLILRILIWLIIGISLGVMCRTTELGLPIAIMATFRSLFGAFISFVIPLIIIGLIVPGIASLGNQSGRSLFLTTVLAYVSTISAGFLAFVIGKLLLPSLIGGISLFTEDGITITPIFTIEMPAIMGVMSALVLAFLLGIGLSTRKESSLFKVCQDFSEIMMSVISKVIVPIVPIYIGSVFAELSYSGTIFTTIKSFLMVYLVLFGLQVLYLIILYTVAGGIKRKNPFRLLKNMFPAYLTAVGTQSSAATIPITLECAKSNDVDEEVCEFVIPLSATIHIAGDTMTLVLTSMAILLLNGQSPTLAMYIPFILMLGIMMIAAPGVPGGGVMAALGLLESMLGFGSFEKPLMIALHAAQDSFGTATNVTGDGAMAIFVERLIKRKR